MLACRVALLGAVKSKGIMKPQLKQLTLFIAPMLVSSLIPGCSSQKSSALTAIVISPTPLIILSAKPPFEPIDLNESPTSTFSSHNGEVVIDYVDGGDPYTSAYQVLATVLWNDKKSQVFQVNRTVIALSSQIHTTLRYNRRKRILTSDNSRSMAGLGLLDKLRMLCHNVTDATIFKKAVLKREGDLKQFGCSCQITDLHKSKNAQDR